MANPNYTAVQYRNGTKSVTDEATGEVVREKTSRRVNLGAGWNTKSESFGIQVYLDHLPQVVNGVIQPFTLFVPTKKESTDANAK